MRLLLSLLLKTSFIEDCNLFLSVWDLSTVIYISFEGFFRMNRYFRGLWRHADFRKLWAGQTISLVGSQVTALALPVAATLTLRATAFQMGLLGVAGALPTLLFGLLAGVWVDRFRRLPLLIWADLGRALLLSIGLYSTLVVATIGIQLGTVILLITPFRKFREASPVSS